MEFLDTNILVYAASGRPANVLKSQIARSLIVRSGAAISLQVLQEFYNVARHPKKLDFTHNEVEAYCRAWRRFAVLEQTLELFDHALTLCANFRIGFYDSSILAAARMLKCRIVSSKDLHPGQYYGGVKVAGSGRTLSRKVCFDTSMLVAALLQQHPHHGIAFPHFRAVREGQTLGHLTTYGLAELFATLTALPLKPRVLPADAKRLFDDSVLKHFALIPLGPAEYQEALHLTVTQNLSSGAIYDALHLVGARTAACETLYTLNLRHFRALAPGDPMNVSP